MDATLRDFSALMLRLWVGVCVAVAHGYPKVADTQAYLASESIQTAYMPVVTGWAVMLGQLIGGSLLAVGLFTRFSSVLVGVVMLGVAFVGATDGPWVTRELALTYAILCLFFIAIGGGKLSLDAHFDRRRRTKSPW